MCSGCRGCLPFHQAGTAEAPLELQRDEAATSHSLVSLQLIFSKHKSQSLHGAGLPCNSLCCWELDVALQHSVLPRLPLDQRSQDPRMRAWLCFYQHLSQGKEVLKQKHTAASKGTNPSINGRDQNGFSQTLSPRTHIPRFSLVGFF